MGGLITTVVAIAVAMAMSNGGSDRDNLQATASSSTAEPLPTTVPTSATPSIAQPASPIATLAPGVGFQAGAAGNYYQKGITFYYNGEFIQAISEFTSAIDLSPGYVDAYTNRGLSHYRMARFDLAIKDYDKSIELNPGNYSTYNLRGLAHFASLMFHMAIEDYNVSIDLHPVFAIGFSNRGQAYFTLGQYNQAHQDYTKALQIDPSFMSPSFNLDALCSLDSQYCSSRPTPTTVPTTDPTSSPTLAPTPTSSPVPTPAQATLQGYSFFGSTQDEVIAAQGIPTEIYKVEGIWERWYYGGSEYDFEIRHEPGISKVEFNTSGNVMGWADSAGILNLPAIVPSGTFGLGSTHDEVIAAQGTPTEIDKIEGIFDRWYYGGSRFDFEIRHEPGISKVEFNTSGNVMGWADSAGMLNTN